MEKVSVRDLKLNEFNWALSNISKIIFLEEEYVKLKQEQIKLEEKISDCKQTTIAGKEGSRREPTKESLEKQRGFYIMKKRELCDYKESLKQLVSHIVSFAFNDGTLFIRKNEINRELSKEYIYLLTEIRLQNGEFLPLDRLFEERAELILLLYEKYGRKQEKLIYKIANLERDEELGGAFKDYFK